MKLQNRPYSAIQVHDNLHKRVQKTTVEKVLGLLSEQEEASSGATLLRCKEYGKSKIFFYNQALLECLSEHAIASIETEITTLKVQVGDAREELSNNYIFYN